MQALEKPTSDFQHTKSCACGTVVFGFAGDSDEGPRLDDGISERGVLPGHCKVCMSN
jgi:hypothetical protein